LRRFGAAKRNANYLLPSYQFVSSVALCLACRRFSVTDQSMLPELLLGQNPTFPPAASQKYVMCRKYAGCRFAPTESAYLLGRRRICLGDAGCRFAPTESAHLLGKRRLSLRSNRVGVFAWETPVVASLQQSPRICLGNAGCRFASTESA